MNAPSGFVGAGRALVGSPGPATMRIAATSAAFSRRRGLVYLAGINAGRILVMTLTACGIATALWAQAGAASLVTIAAAGYFLWLAWRIASTAPLAAAGSTDRRAPTFAAGIVPSSLIPEAYASMAALFSGFVLVAANSFLDAGLKIAVLAMVVFTVDLSRLSVGAALPRHFRIPRHNRGINIVVAALLVLSIAATLLVRVRSRAASLLAAVPCPLPCVTGYSPPVPPGLSPS